MSTTRNVLALLAAALLAAGGAYAGDPGTALKAADVKAEPFRDAQVVGSLAPGDRVEILGRQGGWFQVKGDRGGGWVRMLSVRRGEARKGGGDAAGLLGLASGRAGTGRVVATTGIRGLSEEDLRAAMYNEAELRKIESFAASAAAARRFAASGKLAARKVEYLAAPETGKGDRPW